MNTAIGFDQPIPQNPVVVAPPAADLPLKVEALVKDQDYVAFEGGKEVFRGKFKNARHVNYSATQENRGRLIKLVGKHDSYHLGFETTTAYFSPANVPKERLRTPEEIAKEKLVYHSDYRGMATS